MKNNFFKVVFHMVVKENSASLAGVKNSTSISVLAFDFALEIITLYKNLIDKREYILSKQLLRSGTSIGANVEEASAAQSKKDFIAKMSIASKEARETRYWLKLLDRSKLVDLDYSIILKEVDSIIRILTKIVMTSQHNLKFHT